MTNPIRLRRAFIWDCEECGKQNILPIMEREIGKQEFNKEFGKQYDEFWSLPDALLCSHCKMIFGADDEDIETEG